MRQSSLILSVALLFLFLNANADDASTKGHLVKTMKAAKIHKPIRNPKTFKNIDIDKAVADAYRARREALKRAAVQNSASQAASGGCPSKVSVKSSASPAC